MGIWLSESASASMNGIGSVFVCPIKDIVQSADSDSL